MLYAYKCSTCGPFDSATRADSITCACGQNAKRNWMFKADIPFEAYYSPVFGQVVNSKRHAKDLAKAASAEHTARTGMEANFEVIDLMDDEAVGIKKEEKEFYAAQTRQAAIEGAATAPERKAEIQAVNA